MAVRLLIALTGFALAACGSETEAPPAEVSVPAPPPAVVAPPVSAVALTDASLMSVCTAGLSVIHAQAVSALRPEGVAAGVATLSWPAPVDGGRRYADCRVQNDVIQWRTSGGDASQAGVWSTTEADPVVRFTLQGGEIVLTQTLPGGATNQTRMAIPLQQEAAS